LHSNNFEHACLFIQASIATIIIISFQNLQMPLLKSLLVVFSVCALIAPALTNVGLYIPLYIAPGSDWDKLVTLKKTYPDLPILAIINPNSGPGTSVDPTYTEYINKLQAAGITVHAYDHTTAGNRAIADVKADIDSYKSFYPQIDGIFFDEMSNNVGQESYYTTATEYARSQGFKITDGNPGTNIPESYADTVNIILISETTGTIDLSISSEWPTSDPAKLAVMVHTESSLPQDWVIDACKVVNWLYVTDDVMPNPYDVLPSYLTELAEVINNKCNQESDNKSKLGMILGIIFGVLGGIAVSFGIFFTARRYRLKKNMEKAVTQAVEEKV